MPCGPPSALCLTPAPTPLLRRDRDSTARIRVSTQAAPSHNNSHTASLSLTSIAPFYPTNFTLTTITRFSRSPLPFFGSRGEIHHGMIPVHVLPRHHPRPLHRAHGSRFSFSTVHSSPTYRHTRLHNETDVAIRGLHIVCERPIGMLLGVASGFQSAPIHLAVYHV